MKHDPFIPTAEGCEVIQAQLSDAADSGAPLTPELQTHLDECEACARFAEQWLAGAPAVLAHPVSTVDGPHLRERILDAAAQPNVVPFTAPAASLSTRITWLGRIAACLVVAGLGYWLLNPAVSTVKPRSEVASTPTLAQSLVQMEDRSRQERQLLQTALVDGGSQVRGNVMWTVSALEL